jgi:SWIM zinc finger
MSAAPLTVRPLDPMRYRVTGGRAPHIVELSAAPTCDCPDFAFRGRRRPCKHLAAVTAFRAADPQGPMLDTVSEADTLACIAPPGRDAASEGETPDPAAVAVADAALAAWRRELAARKRTRNTFDPLWLAACATVTAREALSAGMTRAAARWYALARAVVNREAAA